MSVIFHINRIAIVCNLKVPAKLNIGLWIWQVFPLLIEKFSFEEQASLVWQFLCSIPVSMMAEFLPWLSSSISSDECQDMRKCLSRVIPEEKLASPAGECPFTLYNMLGKSVKLNSSCNLSHTFLCLR